MAASRNEDPTRTFRDFAENGSFERMDIFDWAWVPFVPIWIFMAISIYFYRKSTLLVFDEMIRCQFETGVVLGAEEQAEETQSDKDSNRAKKETSVPPTSEAKKNNVVSKQVAAKLAEGQRKKVTMRKRKSTNHSAEVSRQKAVEGPAADGKKKNKSIDEQTCDTGPPSAARKVGHKKSREKTLAQDFISNRKPRPKRGHREEELQRQEEALLADDESDEEEMDPEKNGRAKHEKTTDGTPVPKIGRSVRRRPTGTIAVPNMRQVQSAKEIQTGSLVSAHPIKGNEDEDKRRSGEQIKGEKHAKGPNQPYSETQEGEKHRRAARMVSKEDMRGDAWSGNNPRASREPTTAYHAPTNDAQRGNKAHAMARRSDHQYKTIMATAAGMTTLIEETQTQKSDQ